jgi:hypothetical protein
VPQKKKQKVDIQANFLAHELRDVVFNIHHDLDRNLLDLKDFLLISAVIELVSPYAVCHVIEIINEVNKLHFAVANLVQQECSKKRVDTMLIPFVEEFYAILNNDRQYHFRKRQWI